jgi:hypothetical protein
MNMQMDVTGIYLSSPRGGRATLSLALQLLRR